MDQVKIDADKKAMKDFIYAVETEHVAAEKKYKDAIAYFEKRFKADPISVAGSPMRELVQARAASDLLASLLRDFRNMLDMDTVGLGMAMIEKHLGKVLREACSRVASSSAWNCQYSNAAQADNASATLQTLNELIDEFRYHQKQANKA